ncbi:MAG: hypothetical protein ACRYG8_44990 [Janthinobacterium lividum]
MSTPHPWPMKLTREQKRTSKQRAIDFKSALKSCIRGTRWRVSRGTLFRQEGEWFVDVLPLLLWERGVSIRLTIKPMSLDPLFWNIVGLNGTRTLPLSFRANGAWVLRPPYTQDFISADEVNVEQLASDVLAWCNTEAKRRINLSSMHSIINQLPSNKITRSNFFAVEVCLYILIGDLSAAADLCMPSDPITHLPFETVEVILFQGKTGAGQRL